MNHKFGGGKRPTGTPSLAMSSVVVVVSLLAGASVVHNIYKPDLVRHCLLWKLLAKPNIINPIQNDILTTTTYDEPQQLAVEEPTSNPGYAVEVVDHSSYGQK
ncbi:uncharacterized protein LOC133781702 isoform X2 [Humulus lupulus]|uniref:uncharacterized protein LOC133781702 isoform X2 n=1 Tax=Humulus lupulus TaxID=3486 RepID=UPI002B400A77|nr:uncharacterized protein LOC133781702 isoform X2 [Humulus lupulus]